VRILHGVTLLFAKISNVIDAGLHYQLIQSTSRIRSHPKNHPHGGDKLNPPKLPRNIYHNKMINLVLNQGWRIASLLLKVLNQTDKRTQMWLRIYRGCAPIAESNTTHVVQLGHWEVKNEPIESEECWKKDEPTMVLIYPLRLNSESTSSQAQRL